MNDTAWALVIIIGLCIAMVPILRRAWKQSEAQRSAESVRRPEPRVDPVAPPVVIEIPCRMCGMPATEPDVRVDWSEPGPVERIRRLFGSDDSGAQPVYCFACARAAEARAQAFVAVARAALAEQCAKAQALDLPSHMAQVLDNESRTNIKRLRPKPSPPRPLLNGGTGPALSKGEEPPTGTEGT